MKRPVIINRQHYATAAVLIFLAAFLTYIAVYSHHFLVTWDDSGYITENALVHGLSLANIAEAFKTVVIGNYAPLHLISYMIDYSLWGLNPAGYLFVNILLHSLNGLLLYRILADRFLSPATALFAALVFIVHPVQVESVAWISERKNVLCMLFFLLAFDSYLKADESKRHYPLSLIYYAAALLTKSVAVIFPFMLILHGLSFRERHPLQLRRILPYFAAAVLTAGVAFVTQGPEYSGGRTPYYGGTPLSTAMTMLPVLFTYVRMVFLPVGLSADYLVLIRTTPDLAVLAAGLFLSLLIALGYRLFKTNRPLLFWFALFFLGLLPVSQIIPIITLMNDRYLYFPMLGAAVFLASVAQMIGRRLGDRHRRTGFIAAAAIVIICATLSWSRSHVWKNDLTLWQDAIAKNPENFSAWAEYGAALNVNRQVSAALDAYKRALTFNPESWLALTNISLLYLQENDLLNARHYIFRHIGAYPEDPAAYVNLGRSYYLGENYLQSEKAYLEALKRKSDLVEPVMALADIYMKTGRKLQGEEMLRRFNALQGGK